MKRKMKLQLIPCNTSIKQWCKTYGSFMKNNLKPCVEYRFKSTKNLAFVFGHLRKRYGLTNGTTIKFCSQTKEWTSGTHDTTNMKDLYCEL